MTSIPSMVRLIPTYDNKNDQCQYEAQYSLLKDGDPWITVGTLIFDNNTYCWIPTKDHEIDFSSIDITIKDLYKDFDNRFDPKLFARYKIRKFANEILAGQWPINTVIPPGFADNP